jgi:hypothetical chaperone protein
LAQVRIFWSRAWFRAFLSIFFTMAFLTDTTLGIDFGTSNSAVAVRQGNSPARMLRLEGENNTLPTALFFNAEDHRTHYGRDAVAQYLSGTEGRLMRSLKSLLGSSLLQDKTAVHNALVSYQDIISLFLRMLAQTARETLGGMPGRVLLGRPVHFVDGDDRARPAGRRCLAAGGAGCWVCKHFVPAGAHCRSAGLRTAH